jgi:hypothetical protein
MGYFKVMAKCGHVGKNKYILKWFYVRAEDGKDAARKVRQISRVKHHQKDAIREVCEISLEEFSLGIRIMGYDMYFNVHNSREQRMFNAVDDDEIMDEEPTIVYRKKGNKQYLLYEIMEREFKEIIGSGDYCE